MIPSDNCQHHAIFKQDKGNESTVIDLTASIFFSVKSRRRKSKENVAKTEEKEDIDKDTNSEIRSRKRA